MLHIRLAALASVLAVAPAVLGQQLSGPIPQVVLFKPLNDSTTGGVHAEVYLPTNGTKPEKGWPVVLLTHGGSFTGGDAARIPDTQTKFFLEKGVAVVSTEYRMLPHAQAPMQSEDCLDALRWVRSGANAALAHNGTAGEISLDPARVALGGYSAGGYHALMSSVLASPPVKAVFALYPLTNFEWMGLVDPELAYSGLNATDKAFALQAYDGGSVTSVPLPAADAPPEPLNPRRAFLNAITGTDTIISHMIPNNTYALRKVWSPYHRATASFPPTFIGIPELDHTVPKSQGFAMVRKLTELGVEVQHAQALGADHAFDFVDSPRNLAGGDWWEEVSKPAAEFVISKLAA